MDTYALQLQNTMSDQQRIVFQHEYYAQRKDPVVGVLLAVFLGSFGAHRFYLGQNGIAIIYILFCWTLIPHLIALIEAFFMPGRVRRWNDQMAADVANRVRLISTSPTPASVPPTGSVFCTGCGKPMAAGVQFCPACGAAVPSALPA